MCHAVHSTAHCTTHWVHGLVLCCRKSSASTSSCALNAVLCFVSSMLDSALGIHNTPCGTCAKARIMAGGEARGRVHNHSRWSSLRQAGRQIYTDMHLQEATHGPPVCRCNNLTRTLTLAPADLVSPAAAAATCEAESAAASLPALPSSAAAVAA